MGKEDCKTFANEKVGIILRPMWLKVRLKHAKTTTLPESFRKLRQFIDISHGERLDRKYNSKIQPNSCKICQRNHITLIWFALESWVKQVLPEIEDPKLRASNFLSTTTKTFQYDMYDSKAM